MKNIFQAFGQFFLRVRKRAFIALVMVVIAGGIYSYQKHLAEPVHRALEQEFDRIAPAPSSVPVVHESTYKAGSSLVQTEYSTSVSFLEVQAHYRSELERNGWYLHSSQAIDSSGAQSRSEEVIFCKGPYAASLEYREQASSDSTFWFAVSWGLHSCR
jgi:hypothetical protein